MSSLFAQYADMTEFYVLGAGVAVVIAAVAGFFFFIVGRVSK